MSGWPRFQPYTLPYTPAEPPSREGSWKRIMRVHESRRIPPEIEVLALLAVEIELVGTGTEPSRIYTLLVRDP